MWKQSCPNQSSKPPSVNLSCALIIAQIGLAEVAAGQPGQAVKPSVCRNRLGCSDSFWCHVGFHGCSVIRLWLPSSKFPPSSNKLQMSWFVYCQFKGEAFFSAGSRRSLLHNGWISGKFQSKSLSSASPALQLNQVLTTKGWVHGNQLKCLTFTLFTGEQKQLDFLAVNPQTLTSTDSINET